ncbi:MAG: M1 family metallopeptidase [Gemmatimonadaceae bacterium]|nr:M1 family metallopeptidase [Gemmatimonadaceae bacterium]
MTRLHPRALGALLLVAGTASTLPAQRSQRWLHPDTSGRTNQSIFRAIDLPAPNEYRTSSGRPGPKYWQQRVDYTIRVALDTAAHRITGSERVTYHNNAPEALGYLWFQLDQNVDNPAVSRSIQGAAALPKRKLSAEALAFLAPPANAEGGYRITRVQLVPKTGPKRDVAYVLNGTQMKVPLPTPLATGQTVDVEIDWSFVVPGEGESRNGRGARELVKDGWLYELAQWFPRAAVYDDVSGWQNDQFYGQGEFYLNFGNYDVSITVPRDHIVQATGALANPVQVLTAEQQRRLARALRDTVPVFIVAKDEVGTPGSRPAGSGPLTWRFTAQNVRDFAFATSRAYVWDAAGFRYRPGSAAIELHSLYPREAMPLWDSLSTRAIAQTLRTYGRLAFEYPYPKASNIHGPVFGMEYPMIAFCGARPTDGKYSPGLAYALVAVTIHEVGHNWFPHNWFPMIVASDERKWSWMDEGLNSYLEGVASLEFDPKWPQAQLPIVMRNQLGYLRTRDQVPIMTESDYIHRGFGPNAYTKPASGLYLLREQVLGRESFDAAFRDYAQAWMFKHPQPGDFFRLMQQGAGENLAWFWRGWFYTTHANDQAIATVESQAAEELGAAARGRFYHRVTLENKGGIVMPVVLEFTYTDGTRERVKLPVSIWRNDERRFEYGRFGDKEVASVVADPDGVFGDIDPQNNRWQRPAALTP